MATLLEARSKLQHIKITDDRRHEGEIVLWLNGLWQFGSASEYRYHEALVTLPMCVSPQIDRVLICGGGDGLALRNTLQFKETIPTLCELDPGMLEVFRMPQYAKYNLNSLDDKRAKIIVQDAISFMDHTINYTTEKYNVVIWDFPSPGDDDDQDCSALYTRENVQKALKCLTENGVFVSQVSLPIANLSTIIKELISQDYFVWQYDVYYDTKGNHDAFIVASKKKLWQQRPVPENCRFASPEKIKAGFSQATEIVQADFDYYMQFLFLEDLD